MRHSIITLLICTAVLLSSVQGQNSFTLRLDETNTLQAILDILTTSRAMNYGKWHPNPFNSTVEIRYDLPEGRHVRMEVYDIMGELVKVLVDRDESAGYMVELWDGRDDRGEYVPSGVYFVKVEIGDYRGIMKVVLVR